MKNNPECKRCGLLRSTVLATGKMCIGLSTALPPHDFERRTLTESEIGQILDLGVDCWDRDWEPKIKGRKKLIEFIEGLLN